MNHISRENRRALLSGANPGFYTTWVQLFVPSIVAISIIIYHVFQIEITKYCILLSVALWIVFNLMEWFIHKYLFHRKTAFFEFFYTSHTKQHHVIFISEDMTIRNIDEIKMVMVAFRALVLLGLFLTSVYYIVKSIGYINQSHIFISTALFYIFQYEWLHLCYHLPYIKDLPIIKRLARLHTVHHNTRYMKDWNFNVSLPLWDLILGTYRRN